MRMFDQLRAMLGLAALALLGACGPAPAADDIIVGLAVAQSGPVAGYDDNGVKMAQIFIDDLNAKGGLLGRKLKAVFADTKSDRAEGAKAGQEVLHEGADIVIGTCDYDYGAPALSQAQRAGKISVFLCAEDAKAGVAGIGPNSFTAGFAAQVEGATLAQWGYKKKDFHNAYVLLDDSVEYTKSVCAGFDWMFPKVGGTIVGRDNFKNGDSTVATQITRLRNLMADKKVDVLMFCSYLPGGGSALRQIRAAGINLPIFASATFDGAYWLDGVPDLTDFYVATQASVYGDDPRPGVIALIDKYKAKFKDGPATQFAFPIYAFLELWAKAVTKVGTLDTDKVVAEMNTYRDEPTILGPRSFTPKLHIQDNTPLNIILISKRAGKVVDTWRIDEAVPNDVLFRLKK